jgi:biotin carboxylase
VAVRAIGKVADALGLSGVSYDSAKLSSNKWAMKQAFTEYGVRSANYIKVNKIEEAYHAFEALTPPLIFKSVDNGASKGIVKVTDVSLVEYAFEAVMKATKLDYFIIEEFIEGTEFGAQAFVYDHKLQFVMPHGDLMFYGDTGVPIGHYVPYILPEEVVEDVQLQLEQGIRSLRLNNCAINADFILRDQKVYVLEIGGRAGATCLPELVSTYYGFDYYEQIVRAALRTNPDFHIRCSQPCACELLISNEGGEIVELENGNGNREDIIQISFDYGKGDNVNPFRVGTDRIGQIIVKGDKLEDALNRLEEIKANIRITIKNLDE